MKAVTGVADAFERFTARSGEGCVETLHAPLKAVTRLADAFERFTARSEEGCVETLQTPLKAVSGLADAFERVLARSAQSGDGCAQEGALSSAIEGGGDPLEVRTLRQAERQFGAGRGSFGKSISERMRESPSNQLAVVERTFVGIPERVDVAVAEKTIEATNRMSRKSE